VEAGGGRDPDFPCQIACLGWVLFAQVMLLPLYMHAQDPCAKFLPNKNLLNVLGLFELVVYSIWPLSRTK
jgi:hypothetical protein